MGDPSLNRYQRLLDEMFGDLYVTDTGIQQLPDEILIIIIADLPLSDRKNTRLVCRHWLSLNNIKQISKLEKFSCSGFGNVKLVLRSIERSKRSILNVEFSSVNFNKNRSRFTKFWETCGRRIRSLSFNCCKFSDYTLCIALLCCSELQYLSIKHIEKLDFERSSHDLAAHKRKEKLLPGFVLDSLYQLSLSRMHLCFLELHVSNSFILSCKFLKLISAMHPNLEEVRFSFFR